MVRLIRKLSDFHILAGLLLLSAIVYHRWFSFDIFSFYDYGYKFSETLKDYSNISAWVYRSGFGSADVLLWRLPLLLFQSIFGHLGYGLNIADKFSIMWVWVTFSSLAPYYLGKYISGSRIGGFISAIVFSYNTYFLSINAAGHFNISIASAFGVLSIYFLLRTSSRLIFSIPTAITVSVVGIYDLRVLYLVFFAFVIHFIYFLFVNIKKRRRVFSLVRNYLLIGIIFLLLNTYWIVPLFIGQSVSDSSLLGAGLFGDQFWSIESALVLHHPFWNGGEPNWFLVADFPQYMFTIPAIAAIVILIARNRSIIPFVFMGVIGIFLAKQADYPLGHIYLWLFDNFPGFNAFREATKFYIYIVISYCVLLGVFYSKVFSLKNKNYYIYGFKILLLILLVPLFLNNAYLIYKGNIGATYIKRSISEDSKKINKFISGQNEYFRTLLIPTYPHSWPYTSLHPRVSLASATSTSWRKILESGLVKNSDDPTIDILNQDFSNELLDQSSIKYVAVARREDVNKDDFFLFYGKNREYYIENINSIDYLKKINLPLDEAILYENVNYKPHVYMTSDKESILKESSYSSVEYRYSEFNNLDVKVRNLDNTSYINLSEAFNSKWKLFIGDANIFSMLNSLPDKYHLENDSGLNSFILDPEFIRKNYNDSIIVNQDESLSIDLRIVYLPNMYILPSIIISLVSLLFIVILFFLSILNPKLFRKLRIKIYSLVTSK